MLVTILIALVFIILEGLALWAIFKGYQGLKKAQAEVLRYYEELPSQGKMLQQELKLAQSTLKQSGSMLQSVFPKILPVWLHLPFWILSQVNKK
jgi:hypothetical protein